MENVIVVTLWIIFLCVMFALCEASWIIFHWCQERKEAEKRITEQFFNYK